MSYYLLTIEYDGTDFHGWQKQPGLRTVQGEIETALSAILCEKVEIHGVSRTDAGVHAYAQMAGFKTDKPIPADRLMLALNNILCGDRSKSGKHRDIRIKSVNAGLDLQRGFHARHSAAGKTYVYQIVSLPATDIFLRNYRWQIPFIPDISAMKEAAAYLKGAHDFRAFQSAGGNERESTVKTIYDISVYQGDYVSQVMPRKTVNLSHSQTDADSGRRSSFKNDVTACSRMKSDADANGCSSLENDMSCRLRLQQNAVKSPGTVLDCVEQRLSVDETQLLTIIEVTGSGFLYNMVRIIVGTLLEVGEGKRSPESVKEVLNSGDRRLAGPTAPPQGLYLARVYYGNEALSFTEKKRE